MTMAGRPPLTSPVQGGTLNRPHEGHPPARSEQTPGLMGRAGGPCWRLAVLDLPGPRTAVRIGGFAGECRGQPGVGWV